MSRDRMSAGFRRANLILVATAPILITAAILLRDAGEEVLQLVGLVYLFSVLFIHIALSEYVERREERDQ